MASTQLTITAGQRGCTLQHDPRLWAQVRRQGVYCKGLHFYTGRGHNGHLYVGSRARHGYTAFATTCKSAALAVKAQWQCGCCTASIRNGAAVRVVYIVCKGAADPVAMSYAYAAALHIW